MNFTLFDCSGETLLCVETISIFLIGLISGIFVWGRIIPQIIKAKKTKSMKDISYKFLGLSLTSNTLLLIYGALIKELPIIINAPIALVAFITLIIMKKVYTSRNYSLKTSDIDIDTIDTSNDTIDTSNDTINTPSEIV